MTNSDRSSRFNPFAALGRGALSGSLTTPAWSTLMQSGIGGPGFQGFLQNAALNPGPLSGFLAAPAPVLGLAGAAIGQTLMNALRNWHTKPEDKFPAYYNASKSAAFDETNYNPNSYYGGLAGYEQLASNTKHLNNGGIKIYGEGNRDWSSVQPNEVFYQGPKNADKPYVMLGQNEADALGFKTSGLGRVAVALNRWQNARSAYGGRLSEYNNTKDANWLDASYVDKTPENMRYTPTPMRKPLQSPVGRVASFDQWKRDKPQYAHLGQSGYNTYLKNMGVKANPTNRK